MNKWGHVMHVVVDDVRFQIVSVRLMNKTEQVQAIHYVNNYSARCSRGDRVLMNTSALDLQLGSGGYGIVMAIDSNDAGDSTSYDGHIMKWRYTPHQRPVLAVEAPESEHHHAFTSPFSLNKKPVLLGELHSMLPVVSSLIATTTPPDTATTVAYIMDDQASLSLEWSEHVRHLRKKMTVTTITFGQAVGGDYESVNVYTALECAEKVVKADHIMISHGPGVVGTATKRGFSGMQLIHWLHAVYTSGGFPIVVPRVHFADKRKRHYGLSHHTTQALLDHALVQATIPYPLNGPNHTYNDVLHNQVQRLACKHQPVGIRFSLFEALLQQALEWYGKPITTMGRAIEDDPYFFYSIAAAWYYYHQIEQHDIPLSP